MRILIFGGNGMAGHLLKNYFQQETTYEVYYTTRENSHDSNCISLNILEEKKVEATLQQLQPDIVINAVGILNHFTDQNPHHAIYVNSLFPHHLKQWGKSIDYRLLHISTDCVFSGKKGEYVETDIPDGISVYAKTKSLGEIIDQTNTTIRTSIIGPELKEDGIGLFHWFMQQNGEINGYQNVYWNGVTTLELAKTLHHLIKHPLNGLIHLTGLQKISKYELLHLFKEIYHRDVQINPCKDAVADKSLMNTREDFSYKTPSYPEMLQQQFDWMKNFKEIYASLYSIT